MTSNTTENLLLDQIFKITKSDENISDYLIDCGSPFNSKEETTKVHHVTIVRLESTLIKNHSLGRVV